MVRPALIRIRFADRDWSQLVFGRIFPDQKNLKVNAVV
jgi:hypothetical protein